MYTKKFWYDVLERTIATLAQVALGLLTTGLLFTKEGGIIVLVAGVATVLKALAATIVGASNTASMLPQSTDTDKGHAEPSLVLVVVLGFLIVLIFLRVFGVI